MADLSTPIKIATEVERLAGETVRPLLIATARWPAQFQRIVIRAVIRKLEQHLLALPDA